jgi:cytochrome c oxidase assembly factor CtaG
MPPPLTASTALRLWQFAPAVSAVLAVLAAGYLVCAWRVGRRHPARPWPGWRTAAFGAGLGVIAVATQSSVGVYDDVLFSVHMVQHLLLIMVAPPLLVAGRPVTLLLHSFGNPAHRVLKRAVRSRLATVATWPPGIAAAYCAVVVLTHLTPLMNLVVRDAALHTAEHLLYLVTGYLFFLPVIGSEPIRWRLSMPARFGMLLGVMPVDTITGVILMLLPREIFPAYARTGRIWGPAPLADLHGGGTIMWVGSDTIMIALAVALCVAFVHGPRRSWQFGRWIEGIRAAVLRDQIQRAGLPVPPAAAPADDDAHLAAYNASLAALPADTAPAGRMFMSQYDGE